MSWRALVVAMVAAGCAGSAHLQNLPPATELDVTADDGLTCHVYLTAPTARPATLIFWLGGTGTGSSARIPDELRRSDVAVVTFDKPGVRAPFARPDEVRIDDATFARHTQGTLLSCAQRVLAMATDRLSPTRIVLRGHSEGALIMLGLALSLEPAIARRIRAIVLTGLPLEPFGELIRRQLATRPELARAIAACDWPTMKRLSGVSCAYLADAAKRPSGRELIEQLSARDVRPELDVFAGNSDDLTPARFVDELVTWNTATGRLDLRVVTYAGGHGGSATARRQMGQLIDRLIR